MKKSSIRGYSGFYKNVYLRSSYEYIFYKILEKQNLNFKVEEKTYNLIWSKYTPDFHIYDINNNLIEIAEIKSENKEEFILANKKIKSLSEIVNCKIKIYQLKDLKELCIKYNLNIKELTDYWKSISSNIQIESTKNPMYNKKHSQKTKELIKKKALERCEDENYKIKIYSGLKKFKESGNVSYRPQKTILRINYNCEECNACFEKMENSKQKYCSNKCKLIKTTQIANNNVRIKNNILHNDLRIELTKNFIENLDIINSKKRNFIYKLCKNILIKYNLKDIRNIKFIYSSNYNCKFEELYNLILLDMKNYLKCTPNLQDEKL